MTAAATSVRVHLCGSQSDPEHRPCRSGSKTPGDPEAHDAEETEGGCGEEPGPQGGDHH